MGIVQSYAMTAKAGRESELGNALRALAVAVSAMDGAERAAALQDRKESGSFLFLEFWQDEKSRKAAGAQLPKDVMARVMDAAESEMTIAGFDRLA